MERRALEQLVFEHDFNRALATRFAPGPKRLGLLSLIALDYELVKIRRVTSDLILRRIKIQFWREAIFDNKSAGLPLVKLLTDCFSTSSKTFDDLELLLTAHEELLDQVSLSSKEDSSKKEQCEAALFRLASHFLAPASVPINAAFFVQCGSVYDGLGQLQERWEQADQQGSKRQELIDQTRHSYELLQGPFRKLPDAARAGILPLALIPPYLDLYQRADKKTGKPVDLHPLKKAFAMWRAVRSGFKPVG